MSSDEQFTALGPAIIGFQTHALEPIERGVDVTGEVLGVRGSSTIGPGVIGISGPVQNGFGDGFGVLGEGATGVVGRGGEGPGVKGTGGIQSSFAEAGVIGHGARRPDNKNTERLPHGPGVIGVGGGEKTLEPMKAQFGSVGVFGFGADMKVTRTNGFLSGPRFPGVGVMGLGGRGKSHDDGPSVMAPGVIGYSGSAAGGLGMLHESGKLGDVGVLGEGAVGVRGFGNRGAGVEGWGRSAICDPVGAAIPLGPGVVGFGGARQDHGGRAPVESAAGVIGVATGNGAPTPNGDGAGVYGIGVTGVKGVGMGGGRGGVFESSSRAAQLRLTPVLGARLPQTTTHAPEVADDPPAQGLKLPANGRAGDLMAVSEGRGRCRLWFCVQGTGGRGALWTEVLLGPSFLGVG